ncbi:MAG: PilZ domain-containing protein [Myxococcales bacterium]|jgi:hypothetical protein
MTASLVDRRASVRDSLYATRRRYPRLSVSCDLFYESEESTAVAEKGDVSLRGLFLPCRRPDPVGTRGVVRVDCGRGAMIRMEVQVVRQSAATRQGMALRIVAMSDADRKRLGAFLLRQGGLAAIPQLDRAYRTLTRAPRPRGALLAA